MIADRGRSRIWRHSSNPSASGSIRSSRTMSGASVSSSWSARAPSAETTVSNPRTDRLDRIRSTMFGSSSTSRARVLATPSDIMIRCPVPVSPGRRAPADRPEGATAGRAGGQAARASVPALFPIAASFPMAAPWAARLAVGVAPPGAVAGRPRPSGGCAVGGRPAAPSAGGGPLARPGASRQPDLELALPPGGAAGSGRRAPPRSHGRSTAPGPPRRWPNAPAASARTAPRPGPAAARSRRR